MNKIAAEQEPVKMYPKKVRIAIAISTSLVFSTAVSLGASTGGWKVGVGAFSIVFPFLSFIFLCCVLCEGKTQEEKHDSFDYDPAYGSVIGNIYYSDENQTLSEPSSSESPIYDLFESSSSSVSIHDPFS